MIIGNSASNFKTLERCLVINQNFTFTQLNIIHSTLEDNLKHFSEVITTAVSDFCKSSFKSINAYGKQTIKFRTDLVLNNSGRLRPTNFFVSANLMLLLSRLIHYEAMKDNKNVKT